ncbi:MAG: M20/M25/M40 family metallo-hydrolase [Chitinophagales bacterium]|nr:M20/M25/M40 family metallo-hydrolase [Chitinophagales bacterium]
MRSFFILLVSVFILCSLTIQAQQNDEQMLKRIHDEALAHGQAYGWLETLCRNYPGRIAGSDIYIKAAEHTLSLVKTIRNVNGYLQECEANYWDRGDKEEAHIKAADGTKSPLNVLALGNSVRTPENGITAEIIEVHTLDEVQRLGREKIEGKIVFYNRPMNPTFVETFEAYGDAVDQRTRGPYEAAQYGAVAAMVRSVSLFQSDYPHTRCHRIQDTIHRIPTIAISTNDANRLSKLLSEQKVEGYIETNCHMVGPRYAPNVIGEIKGSTHPDEIILVGGHLDSWDNTAGAHDDGAGVVQSIEVLRILTEIGYKPKRTIRCVLFSNEENGLAGGKEYARVSNENNEFHLFAIESDAGGFTPRGFVFEADKEVLRPYMEKLSQWEPLLENYGLLFKEGYSGADVHPLLSQKGLLGGLMPDSQRYFEIHHAANDTIDKVNPRELELGAAAMASLIYLIDQHGLK